MLNADGRLCCYCDQPVDYAAAFYAGNPIHPDCENAFRAEMDAAFPDEDNEDMDVEAVDEGDESWEGDRWEDDDEDDALDPNWDDDGQPSEYEEWQDYMGGDDSFQYEDGLDSSNY